MAYSYVWPASLPKSPLAEGFSESRGARILRTPMDLGPAKQRRRGRRADVMPVSMAFTTAELATFETFVNTTLRGVARFGVPHPRTGAMVEVRLVPQEDGELYKLVPLAGRRVWRVSFTLEVLP